jgi:hypothetical protein
MSPDMDNHERYVRTENIGNGLVDSTRNVTSAAVSMCAAIGWLDLAGGELTGSGLDPRAYERADVAALIGTLTAPQASPEERIALIGDRFWGRPGRAT